MTAVVRVWLVGSPAERARLRSRFEASGVAIVGESATLESARAASVGADVLAIAAPEVNGRFENDEAPAIAEDDIRRSDGPRAFGNSGDDAPLVEPLTARERQVLQLLAEGLPNKSIAGRLGISDQTVKFHVASIYGKLGAANRTQAVRRAVRRGLVTL